ncbi:hypothetical protein PR202_ga18042 [Eleusine coracana subsp. coracana]|uniref:Uncharacterized protein n=1 Tax=Eleusine coracana subsp. coracana TaxID=191504 RepID=A0AAV5CS43_ELECO|nr:hypothetical protein PR202_ga18042 [Eleusine coracana subsp. coracana]
MDGNVDGEVAMNWTSALEDTKPQINTQDLSVADYLPDLPTSAPAQEENRYLGNGNNRGSNIDLTSHQNLLLPSSGFSSSSFGTLESILPQNVLHPVITDAVSPSLETSTSTSGMQHTSNIVQLQPQIGPLHVSQVRRPPIPRNPRREPVGVQALPVPQHNSGSSRRLQANTFNCPPPVPLSSPASSTYQAHHIMNPDSVMTPRNSGGDSLPRTPRSAPLLHQQSTTVDTRNTSSHLSSRVVGLPVPSYFGPRQSPAVLGQAGGANAYRSRPLLDQLVLQNRLLNQSALAASGQNSAAAQVRPAQADIQSHLFPAQQSQALRAYKESTPRALARAPLHLQPPSVPTTVASSAPQVGISDGSPDLPVDENWRPTGQMRGSLTGRAYNQAIDRHMIQPTQQQNQIRPPSTPNARRPH